MRNLFADGILRHVTLFRSRKIEGWNLFLLIVSAYFNLPFKCFFNFFFIICNLSLQFMTKRFGILFFDLSPFWRHQGNVTFYFVQTRKIHGREWSSILDRWCPFKSFFKAFVNRDVSIVTDFCSHALKNLHFLLKYVVIQDFLINLLA